MSRTKFSRYFSVLFLGVACTINSVSAAVLLEQTQLVAKTAALAQVAPPEQNFDVVTSGRYRATLSDIGFPAPLTSADLVITKGIVSVARLTHTGTVDFDATPGTYTVRVLGGGTSAGTLGVSVMPVAGGAALLNFSAGISSNPTGALLNQSSLSASFTPNSAGSYQVSLTDRLLPNALTSFDLTVVDASGVVVGRMCAPATSACTPAPFTISNLNVARYDLFITARAAAPENAGLYSVQISGGSPSAVAYATTQPVGTLTKHADIPLTSAGPYSLALSDLKFPAALLSMRAALVQGSDVIATTTGSASTMFSASNGTATLYTFATAANAPGEGVFSVQITRGTQTVFGDVRAVTLPTLTTLRAYAFSTPIPSSGLYRFQIKDFAFPSSIASLQTLVTQNGASLGNLATAGSMDAQAVAAPVIVIVLANMISPTALGLFGVGVDGVPPSTVHVFDATQAVGDIFSTRTLSVNAAGSLDVSLNDLAFPVGFGNLAVAVTRGTMLVGQIFGGGKFSFNAVPGDYALSFVAGDGTTVGYGLYGIKLEDSPIPPVVTLTASPSTVASGGTTTLTWTAAGATSCVASGGSGGWSGSQPLAGSATSVGPFSADSSLTLACTGVGGTSSAVAKIIVTSDNTKSGGGAVDAWWLLAMALATLSRRGVFVRSTIP